MALLGRYPILNKFCQWPGVAETFQVWARVFSGEAALEGTGLTLAALPAAQEMADHERQLQEECHRVGSGLCWLWHNQLLRVAAQHSPGACAAWKGTHALKPLPLSRIPRDLHCWFLYHIPVMVVGAARLVLLRLLL